MQKDAKVSKKQKERKKDVEFTVPTSEGNRLITNRPNQLDLAKKIIDAQIAHLPGVDVIKQLIVVNYTFYTIKFVNYKILVKTDNQK